MQNRYYILSKQMKKVLSIDNKNENEYESFVAHNESFRPVLAELLKRSGEVDLKKNFRSVMSEINTLPLDGAEAVNNSVARLTEIVELVTRTPSPLTEKQLIGLNEFVAITNSKASELSFRTFIRQKRVCAEQIVNGIKDYDVYVNSGLQASNQYAGDIEPLLSRMIDKTASMHLASDLPVLDGLIFYATKSEVLTHLVLYYRLALSVGVPLFIHALYSTYAVEGKFLQVLIAIKKSVYASSTYSIKLAYVCKTYYGPTVSSVIYYSVPIAVSYSLFLGTNYCLQLPFEALVPRTHFFPNQDVQHIFDVCSQWVRSFCWNVSKAVGESRKIIVDNLIITPIRDLTLDSFKAIRDAYPTKKS